MTRTDSVKRNLVFTLIRHLIHLVSQFLIRTLLIYFMGREYIGLNGLFINIFNFLNLTELGLGSAIIFSMYKPIAENDVEKVKTLQNIYKKFYFYISLVVFVIGIALMPLLNFLLKDPVTVDINVYVLYVLYLLNTIIGYMAAHKRSLIFAYQRNDVENKIGVISLVILTVGQVIVLLITKNYYIFYGVTIFCTLLECILIHHKANKMFPEISGRANSLDLDTKKEITKNVIALSMHKVGNVVVTTTDNLILSALFGFAVLGSYSNYSLIVNSIIAILTLVYNAFCASVGNLIATKDNEYSYQKFKTIKFMFSYFVSFAFICLVVLIQPFIEVWTGGGEYLLNNWVVILYCLSFYFSKIRLGVLLFKEAAGLFWQDRLKPVIEAIINLIASILLAKFIGVAGIFLGTIISTLTVSIWIEPKVLYGQFFNKKLGSYFLRLLVDFVITICATVICWLVCSLIPSGPIIMLITKFIVCVVVSNIILILVYFRTREFRELFNLAKNIFKNIFMRKRK